MNLFIKGRTFTRNALPIALLSILAFAALPANAMQIQEITSKKGIKAWLVEDHTRPIVSLQFAFQGGAAQDPAEKPGVTTFVCGMMDEGAGDLTSEAFQQRLEDLAAKMNFSPSYDHVAGSFQMLSKNRDESLKLLKAALISPHFDAPDAERIRQQLLANLKVEEKDPDKVASHEWFKLAFGAHPYGKPVGGTQDSVSHITPDDLHRYVKRIFARDNVKVAVVGDIDPASLSEVLDSVFGELPEKSDRMPVSNVSWQDGAKQKILQMPNPQSVAQFGFKGLLRKDPDFIPGFILNYVIGGGGFSSKLMQEVREKRGLAYSVYTYLYPLEHTGIFAGGVATENKEVGHSLDVIKSELERAASDGLTEQELKAAKDYLIGSYALRFDTSVKIAGQLLAIQLDNLGIGYIEKRNSEIEAITAADIKRVAKRLLDPKNLIVIVVGEPEGVKEVGL